MSERVTLRQFSEAEGTGDWRIVGDGACAFFATPTLDQAARFVAGIAALPAIETHLPDIDIRPGGVTVRLVTADEQDYGMSARDIELARQISGIAAAMGNVNSNDNWQVHFRDTMRGGKFLNSWRMAAGH